MAKILLVEDDNNLREIYEARLQAEGYNIVSASDGEEALVVAKAEKPDMIIADVMMPKISGFEMLDILRNTEGLKEVKVIMLTALGQNDDQQRANRLGADRYLVKSQVTLEDIVKVAHELLNDQSASAEPKPAQSVPAEPIAEPQPSSEPADVQSEAEEEAGVNAKIEYFVAGATQEATPPATVPESVSEPAAASGPTEPSNSAGATDDPTTDSAVQTFNDSVAADNTTDTAEPASTPTEPATPGPADAETLQHKKVIEPIDSPPKKDIQELLAEENAVESAQQQAPGTQTEPSETGDDTVDPHSIAL